MKYKTASIHYMFSSKSLQFYQFALVLCCCASSSQTHVLYALIFEVPPTV